MAKAKTTKAKAKRTAKAKAKAKPAVKPKAKPARKPKVATTAKTKTKAKAKPKAKPAAKPKPRVAKKSGVDNHPGYQLLASKLAPGRYAGGALFITEPGAFDEQMEPWLMGNVEGRRSLGRTAFGDIVVFRDLRERARELGVANADTACDVAIIDIHHKKMTMIAESAQAMLKLVDSAVWANSFLRGEMYNNAKQRIGDYADDECFCFVPALSLGGSYHADSVQRANWNVHQAILIQT